ncbi:MAG TPA: beta-propeller fold lactonase family protein [Solirubrobacterales bacterium]|nr:beta-propeller fold lactonase family protein [Solirubrobacterales bacterium]
MSRRLVLFVLGALLGTWFVASTATAARLYIPNYGSGPPEEIGGFDLSTDGSLTPIPGSPFPGATAGASDGLRRLAFTPDGGRAATGFFVGDGGVQGYSVPANGIFGLAAETPTGASVTSLAITPDGRFAYAGTREFGGHPAEGVHRFAVDADGSLIPLGPPTPLPGNAYEVAVSSDGRFLFAAEGAGVSRFAIQSDGGLAPLGMTPLPGASGLAISTDERYLYVYVEAGGEPGVAVLAIGADGGLAQRGTTAQYGPGSSGRSAAVTPDGRFAFLIDTNADLIGTVAIAEDGSPTLLPGGLSVTEPESMRVSPDGRHLVYYHEDGTEFVLEVAAIGADGALTKLPTRVLFGGGERLPVTFQPVPTPVARFTVQPRFRATRPASTPAGPRTPLATTGTSATGRR